MAMQVYSHTARALPVALALLVGCGSANGSDGDGEPPPGDSPPQASQPAPDGPVSRRPAPGRAWVIFGSDTVTAEVARTSDERAQGLMHRTELPPGTGMLFVFEDQRIRSFWMDNTYVALDIAFLDSSFRVVDIQQMEPETTEPHESVAPAMFALEVPQGWFEAHGVTLGDQAEIVFGG